MDTLPPTKLIDCRILIRKCEKQYLAPHRAGCHKLEPMAGTLFHDENLCRDANQICKLKKLADEPSCQTRYRFREWAQTKASECQMIRDLICATNTQSQAGKRSRTGVASGEDLLLRGSDRCPNRPAAAAQPGQVNITLLFSQCTS